MGDEKDEHRYETLPVPSYEEATSSRPTSSQSRRGPEEISDDAERQGLLSNNSEREVRTTSRYRPPTAESERSSLDFLPPGEGSESGSTAGLRHELEQLEIEEPDGDNGSHRSLLTNRFSKRLTSLTNSLSSIHLPFRLSIPSFTLPRIVPGTWAPDENHRIVIVGRMIGALMIIAVVYLLLASDVLSLNNQKPFAQRYDLETVRAYIQSRTSHNGRIKDDLEYLARDVHMAGTKGSAYYANWIRDMFEVAGLEDVTLEKFDVYMNFPREGGRKVAIVDPPDKIWEAQIEENSDAETRQQSYSPVFHGLSKAGDVKGPLIYANHASEKDLSWLEEEGISVKGAILIIRSGGAEVDDAFKVRASELAGAAGCIIYSDLDTGDAPWPSGKALPVDGVRRTSVALRSWVIGDVLSPGWASKPEEKKRLSVKSSTILPKIPSIPLSWRDGKGLLEALEGHGRKPPKDWQGGSLRKGYWTGNEKSPVVNLKNLQDEVVREPIRNVLGRISGWEQSEKKVIVGNHRDAWCLGATGPGSGTAVMLEVMRAFGELSQKGWRPLRTIEFANWDGGEYNLIGSTEHVEDRQDILRRDGIAYLNMDVGVSGPDFWAAASPLYQRALLHVLDRTSDPSLNRTLGDLWDSKKTRLEGLGAGSDFAAFQDIVGTSAIDVGFRGQPFAHGSCYDNFAWAAQLGGEAFGHHVALAQVLALLILELANAPILPFDMGYYAQYLENYVHDLDDYVKAKADSLGGKAPDLKGLVDCANEFKTEAHTFHEWERAWEEVYSANGGQESNVMAIKRMSHNNRMANFEKHLLDLEDGGGLPNRTQFKHILFAPQKYSSDQASIFPAIRDAIDDQDWAGAQQQVDKAARILKKAIHKLNHN